MEAKLAASQEAETQLHARLSETAADLEAARAEVAALRADAEGARAEQEAASKLQAAEEEPAESPPSANGNMDDHAVRHPLELHICLGKMLGSQAGTTVCSAQRCKRLVEYSVTFISDCTACSIRDYMRCRPG